MSESVVTQTPIQPQPKRVDHKKSPVKQMVETPSSTTATLRRRSKTPDNTPDHHRVLSNIENKESTVVPVRENGKPNDNHYIKNKNLQSPVNRNKVCWRAFNLIL